MRGKLIRREKASESILMLVIWAVASVILTRFWLNITGQPQITFGIWHIAHVLFGGMGMLIGILIMLVWSGEKARQLGVFFSGIGWGLFIDEVGKYVTKDNDYWFRPAIIIIYISFVLLFLLYRKLAGEEKIMNQGLRVVKWVSKTFHITYDRIFRRKITLAILGIYSIYYSVDKLIDTANIFMSEERMATVERFYRNYDFLSKTDTYMIGFKIGFDVLTAILFIGGWYWAINKRRIRALSYFQYGLLINILIGSIFKFYFEQFSGVIVFGVNILFLAILAELRQSKVQVSPKRKV